MKRVARLALALAVVFAFGVGPLFGSTEPRRGDGAARRLYERSQLAASEAAFSGVIAIQWRGRSGVHQATVHAVRVGGVLQVDGKGGRLLAAGARRWERVGNRWTTSWDLAGAGRGNVEPDRWRFDVGRGSAVAGVPTTTIEARDAHTGLLRARYYVTRSDAFLLRREVLDRAGRVSYAVGFVEFSRLADQRPHAPTNREQDRAPHRVSHIETDFRAPDHVGAYQLVGRYERADGTLQLLYTDGLFSVSVFQRIGDLDPATLPPDPDRWEVANDETARAYASSAGPVAVWSTDDAVVVAVSDGPTDELHTFASGFDRDERSVGEKIADFVLGPFGWN